MKALIGIYGAGGFGREVASILSRSALPEENEIVFIDDADLGTVNGFRCLRWQDFLEEKSGQKSVSIAISDSGIREKLADKVSAVGIPFQNAFAQSSSIFDHVSMGEGAIIGCFASITTNIEIGKQFHCNNGSYVAHDCVIGDFVTFAPSVTCNGNVVIEDHAYIGAGAILKQGKPGAPLRIGKGAVVGMGAVVTKDVPPGVTVVGNPARPMTRG